MVCKAKTLDLFQHIIAIHCPQEFQFHNSVYSTQAQNVVVKMLENFNPKRSLVNFHFLPLPRGSISRNLSDQILLRHHNYHYHSIQQQPQDNNFPQILCDQNHDQWLELGERLFVEVTKPLRIVDYLLTISGTYCRISLSSLYSSASQQSITIFYFVSTPHILIIINIYLPLSSPPSLHDEETL